MSILKLRKKEIVELSMYLPTASVAVVVHTHTRARVGPSPSARGGQVWAAGGLGRQRASLPPLPSPLRGRKWPGLRSLLVRFLAGRLLSVGDRLLAFIVLLNSSCVELSPFSMSRITSGSRSVRMSLSARRVSQPVDHETAGRSPLAGPRVGCWPGDLGPSAAASPRTGAVQPCGSGSLPRPAGPQARPSRAR